MTMTRRQTPAPYDDRRLSSDRAAMTIGDNIGLLDDNPRQPLAAVAPQSRRNRKCALKNRNRQAKVWRPGRFA
jgi:hypothetical protein